jgi:hypothetical protein
MIPNGYHKKNAKRIGIWKSLGVSRKRRRRRGWAS